MSAPRKDREDARMAIARFAGEPMGYLVPAQDVLPTDVQRLATGKPWWMWVELGMTKRRVLIDLQKAYVIEPADLSVGESATNVSRSGGGGGV